MPQQIWMRLFVLWQADESGREALCLAFGDCSRVATIQSMAMIDPVVRGMVATHMQLTSIFANTAIQGGTEARILSETVRRHTRALISALAAHVSGESLPAYHALDVTDRNVLLRWGADDASAEQSGA